MRCYCESAVDSYSMSTRLIREVEKSRLIDAENFVFRNLTTENCSRLYDLGYYPLKFLQKHLVILIEQCNAQLLLMRNVQAN